MHNQRAKYAGSACTTRKRLNLAIEGKLVNIRAFSVAILGVGCCAGIQVANAALVQHFNKTVLWLETDAVNSCIFFRLADVNEANPVVPNDVYFAIDMTKANAKEMYASILGARLSGSSVNRVLTNGEVACGKSKVLTIDL